MKDFYQQGRDTLYVSCFFLYSNKNEGQSGRLAKEFSKNNVIEGLLNS